VNVSRALAAGDVATVAVIPSGGSRGPVRALLAPYGVQVVGVPIAACCGAHHRRRAGRTTTKFNEAGRYSARTRSAPSNATVVEVAAVATWVAGAGSLPGGLGNDFYGRPGSGASCVGRRASCAATGAHRP